MKRPMRWIALAGAVLLVGGGVAVWWWQGRVPGLRGVETPSSFPLPPLSASEFLNTSANARYVGYQACIACHRAQYGSYRKTAHGQALNDVHLDREPAAASFHHAASGQTCTVSRANGQMYHAIAARDSSGQEYVREDHPLRYLIGSGHHSRSYLVEIDGFLCESPLTWYASRKQWDMSPGYDRPNHRGFERPADSTCLFCHAGQTSSPERNYQRLSVVEQPIGCERCHGPGSLHVSQEQAIRDGLLPAAERQPTIVHPGHLPTRALREALCAQCHLNADSVVDNRGRSLNDFRPGLPLSDFCINYRLDEPDAQMKVVGHVDQLHLSRCYRTSKSLTCTTCHDPHLAAPPGPEHYRKVCLNCHGSAGTGCKLQKTERLRRSPGNDCLGCHMPRVGTDIPHIAFTHHRIGIHSDQACADSMHDMHGRQTISTLSPVDDVSHLSDIDRQRSLGLAYFSLSQRQSSREAAAAYQDRAEKILSGVRAQGLRDGDVAAALARLRREVDPEGALQLGREALTDETLSLKYRVNTLFLVSELSLQTSRIDDALEHLQQLTALRRQAQDWLLLALCRLGQGNLPQALHDLRQAIAIAPFRPDLHQRLADIVERTGNTADAARERSIAQRLAVQPATKH